MITLDKIGSDPEFAIINDKGQTLPSFMFFEGTKEFPERMGNGFAVLKDNLLVEGNIPACSTKEEFVDTMKMLKEMISIPLKQLNAKILSVDSADYEDMWIYTPDGCMFGCSTYRSAYKRGMIDTPILEGNARDVGFHIHISYNNHSGYSKGRMDRYIAKAMDYFLGIPSDQIHYSKERRENYGELGSYRQTSYGMEYRSLGGFFTQDKYLSWVYEQTVKAIEFCSIRSNLTLLEDVRNVSINNYSNLNIKMEEQLPVMQTKLV